MIRHERRGFHHHHMGDVTLPHMIDSAPCNVEKADEQGS
jgi:hypothetical protein